MARKLMLVEPRMLETLQRNPLRDPLAASLTGLDREMQEIIEREDLDESTKVRTYQQLLQRYLTKKEQYKERPLGKVEIKETLQTPTVQMPTSTTVPPDIRPVQKVEERLLKSVPNVFKRKAEMLLDHLKNDTDIGWTENGEIKVGDRVVKGSNLIDLTNDVLRNRLTSQEPSGWKEFSTALRQSNVPRELIGNRKRWQYIKSGPVLTTPPTTPQKPTWVSY